MATQLNEPIVVDDVETLSSQVSEQPSEMEDVQQVVKEQDEDVDSANPIEEAKAYLISIAEQLAIHDLDIATTREGKYVLFQLKVRKLHCL